MMEVVLEKPLGRVAFLFIDKPNFSKSDRKQNDKTVVYIVPVITRFDIFLLCFG